MSVNRSHGGQSEYVRKAAENELVPPEPPHSQERSEVCRLLTALVNATIKQLNSSIASPLAVTDCDVDLALAMAELARSYKGHLSSADAIFVAQSTSEDLSKMRDLVHQIDDSRRLDGILAKANDILSLDDVTFSRNHQEIWLGRRIGPETQYYLSARITRYPFFDAAPPAE